MPGQNLLLGELDVGLDTYLIIPASSHTCLAEIQNLEAWADRNNLKLNRKKSCEIVFIRPKSNWHTEIPPPAVQGFDVECSV